MANKNKNENVVIALFESEAAADQAIKELKAWEDVSKEIKLGAVGTITKKGKKVKTHVGRKGGKGAKVGATLGIIAGVLSGGVTVVGGAIGGAAMGGITGAFFKKSTNMTKENIQAMGQELDAGKVAVVVACDDYEVEAVSDHLALAGGSVQVHEVPAEAIDEAAVAIEAATEEVEDELPPEEFAEVEVEEVAEEEPASEPVDDFTMIEGIGPKMAVYLGEIGITTYTQLANTSEPALRASLKESGHYAPKNIGTWSMQASYAAKGDWNGLSKFNESSKPKKEAEPAVAAVSAAAPAASDDLTQIAGIGPKTAVALNGAGITTYAQLASTSEPALRQAVHSQGVTPPPSLNTWSMQATFAAKGDWSGLYKFNQSRGK